MPAGRVDFGITAHPTAIIPHASQFDFYNGGGLDATFMGAGQVDRQGNVNVSRLGGRIIGAGGFIDITQSARLVCFCFTLEGSHEKFVDRVDQLRPTEGAGDYQGGSSADRYRHGDQGSRRKCVFQR